LDSIDAAPAWVGAATGELESSQAVAGLISRVLASPEVMAREVVRLKEAASRRVSAGGGGLTCRVRDCDVHLSGGGTSDCVAGVGFFLVCHDAML
jgi:hypothetical protein